MVALVAAGCSTGPGTSTTPSGTAAASTESPPVASASSGTAAWEPCPSVLNDEGAPPEPTPPEPLESLVALTASATIPVATDPVSVAYGAGAVWVASIAAGTITKIDPAQNAVTGTVELGDELGFAWIAADDTGVWVAGMGDHSLTRLDPETLEATTISLGEPVDRPYTIALGDGSVWVSSLSEESVRRIDPADLSIVATIDVRPAGAEAAEFAPSAVGVDESGVWVVEHRGDALTRIDPATNAVTDTICLGTPEPGRMALADGSVWVADNFGVINRVSASSKEIEARFWTPGPAVGTIEAGDGALWVANASHLVRVDPVTNAVDAAYAFEGDPPEDQWAGGFAAAYGAGSAWAIPMTENAIVRVTAP